MSEPLAYLITWTTYGSWLPGDGRGWVDAHRSGIKTADEAVRGKATRSMAGQAVVLDQRQRAVTEQTIREHCALKGWRLHALNVRSNHVHLVVMSSGGVRPEKVMSELKAWCSRRLNEATERRRWWTRHGSTKWINDEAYLRNAIRYVNERQ